MSNQQKQSGLSMFFGVVMAKHARLMIFALISSLTALALAHFFTAGGFNSIDQSIFDIRAASPTVEPSGDAILVDVSERTLEHFGHWPIPRREIARALTLLASGKPERVYIDFVFDIAREPAGDLALAQAFALFDKTKIAVPVSPMSRVMRSRSADDFKSRIAKIFQDKVTLVDSSIHYSADGLVRSLQRSRHLHGQPAMDVIEWLNGRENRYDKRWEIDFSIRLEKIKRIDLLDILNGSVNPQIFHNKKIIVGSNIHGVNQLVPVPVYNLLSRTQVLALANETIMLGRGPHRVPFLPVLLIVCATSISVTFLTTRMGAIGGFLITLIFGFNLILVTNYAFTSHAIILPVAFPMTAVFLSFIIGLIAVHPLFEDFRLLLNGLLGRIDIRLAKVLGEGKDAIVTFDQDQVILSMNAAAEQLTGKTASQCVGKKLETILPKNGSRLVTDAAMHTPGRVETVAQCADGRLLPVDLTFNTLPTDDCWIGYVCLKGVTAHRRVERELTNIAYIDSLTGLANRASFYHELARLRSGAARSTSSAVLLLDLDDLKSVNNELGHQPGDMILKEMAKRLTSATGSSAFVARIGGAEFAIIQRGTPSVRGSERLAVRILDEIRRPIQIEDRVVQIGTSIGIAHYPDHSRKPEEVLKLADFAMYEAKRNGLGYSFADPILDQEDLQSVYVN